MVLLLHISILIMTIFWINCDQICDCNQIEPLKEIVQHLMLEQKLDSVKLRKMEARQRSATQGSVWTTGRLSKMETNVNFLLQEKLHDKGEDISTVLKKTLTSEKLERINFGSELESQMTKMKDNLEIFKTETTSKVGGYIANISDIQYDLKRDVNGILEDIKGQTERTVSKVVKDVTSSQNLYKLEIDGKLENFENFKTETTSKVDGYIANIRDIQYDLKQEVYGILQDIKGQTERTISQVMKDVTSSQNMYKREIDGKLEKTKADVIKNNRQIAFTGKISKSIPLQRGSRKNIRFDELHTNLGNAYNTATGKFTCPISGLYLVTCNAIGDKQGYVALEIYLDEKEIARPYTGSGDGFDPASDTAVVHANAGDAIYAKTGYSTSEYIDHMSRFVVVLLKAD